jgi:hypothetical protein
LIALFDQAGVSQDGEMMALGGPADRHVEVAAAERPVRVTGKIADQLDAYGIRQRGQGGEEWNVVGMRVHGCRTVPRTRTL